MIGEGSNARTIKVRSETIPLLIQVQNKKGDKLDEVKVLREELKEQRKQLNWFQERYLQREISKPKAQAAGDPLNRLVEEKGKLERSGIIQLSEEEQMQPEYGPKNIKIFDREKIKSPVRKILLPCTTSLRPMDIFNTKFTYKQAMKKDENPRSEPTRFGALFPHPLKSLLKSLF